MGRVSSKELAIRLGNRLGILIRDDPKLTTFGAAHGHRFQLGKTLTEEDLAAFESEYSVTLPDQYRAFLKYVGNGGAGPGYGIWPLDEAFRKDSKKYGKTVLSTPFEHMHAVGEGPNKSLIGNTGWEARHQGCLYLCDHGCGMHNFLVVTGPAKGQVWTDYTCERQGVWPSEFSFNAWYKNWLNESLMRVYANMLGKKLMAGD
jgi:hypothetical protein